MVASRSAEILFVLIFIPVTKSQLRTSAFETTRVTFFSANSRCKRRISSRKRLKRQKKKGGKLLVDLVKLAKIAISPVLGKGLAQFVVAAS